MQLLLEFFPLVAFLIAYKVGGIYTATSTLMITMTASLAITWLRTRRLPAMFGVSTALVLVLGTVTLLVRDVRFIQWKPSIFLWLIAAAFLVSAFVGEKPLAQRALETTLGDIKMDRSSWQKLNFAWVLFGAVLGAINILAAYHTSEATWVNIKVYGLTGAMFAFTLAQVLWLHRRGKLPQ